LSVEREQNRNQATADITRPSPSSSSTDQSRIALPSNGTLVVNTSNSFSHLQNSATAAPGVNVSTGTQTHDETASDTVAVAKPLTSGGECYDDEANEHRGKKRYLLLSEFMTVITTAIIN